MPTFTKRFLTFLEQLGHGTIVGGLIGALAGVSEYFLLRQGFSGDPAKAYWDILAPYATVGCVAGILLAMGMRLILGKAESFSRHIARLSSSFIALVVLSYLIIWATYRLGLPVLKLANLIAYAASAAVSIIGGLLLNRALSAILLRLERLSSYAVDRLRIGIPLAQCALIVLVFLWPTMYLATAHSNRGLPRISPKDGMRGQQPNIVFILIDALRADHLPIYGYSRQTAPNLTAFARRAMTFTRMYAQAASTRPSVATIFTSLYPSVHKANENRDFLSTSIPVLPESLRAAGYKTFGISANANVSPTFGYSRGFDEFKVWKTESAFRLTMMGKLAEDLIRPGPLGRLLGEKAEIVPTADAITDATLNWLSQSNKGPLFLYVHYIDPHDPYRPPPPYDRAFDHRSDPPIRAGGGGSIEAYPQRGGSGTGRAHP